MTDMDTRGTDLSEFGAALERALNGRQPAWLGAEIARELGQDTPITRSAVAQWVAGDTEPSRDKVFAAEKVLNLRPGTLSRLLGYLPVDAKDVRTVIDAVAADTKLKSETKKILIAAYRAAVPGG